MGGINMPWLYSGESIHQPHIRDRPSQNRQMDRAKMMVPARMTGDENPQTVPRGAAVGRGSEDIGVVLWLCCVSAK